MSKNISEEEYLILLQYFDGTIDSLNKEIIDNLKKNQFDGNDIPVIDSEILKKFSKILRIKKNNPEKYSSYQWNYPNWDQKKIDSKLKEVSILSKKMYISKDEYLILLQYFNGDIIYLTKKIINNLKNNQFNGKEIPEIDSKILKKFLKILKRKETDPKKYASYQWIYPDWDQETIDLELKKQFPSKMKKSKDKIIKSKKIDPQKIEKHIIPQRKAFIEWINNVFYKKQIDTINQNDIDDIKVYQLFVKEYLSSQTPFRGLLVYHGLGTGKSASSVITAEGLSNTMEIYTFLTKSIINEYIEEVKKWGDQSFQISKNNWTFYSLSEIKSNHQLRLLFDERFGFNTKSIKRIYNTMKRIVMNKKETGELDIELSDITSYEGIFVNEKLSKDDQHITISGESLLSKDEDKEKGKELTSIEKVQKILIDEGIKFQIKKKYNFINYKPLPKFQLKSYDDDDKDQLIDIKEEPQTEIQEIIHKFHEKYLFNLKNHQVRSPFYNNVIVIDEVHNLIREILNKSVQANIFYQWIINSENIKLIFLSGTPIINKPAEIAILYNMLRGIIQIFDFSIQTRKSEEEIHKELTELFFKKKSSIEQFHVYKRSGKMIVSFIKNKTNFESILDSDNIIKTIQHNNHTIKEFLNEISNGLSLKYKTVLPSKKDIRNLSEDDLNTIKLGKEKIFDKEINLIFNRNQNLFDIYDHNEKKDLTNNEIFMDYFFNDELNMYPKKKVLLRRMLLGLTSYYPIDRSSITNMPQIIEPYHIVSQYSKYLISKNINIIPCYMSYIQWLKYEIEYSKEKWSDLRRLRKQNVYDEGQWHYRSNTRQNCNIIYENDSFKKSKDHQEKLKSYDGMLKNGHFSIDKTLDIYSPKFYQILKNIEKFIHNDLPIGKILYYSTYVHDGGSEAFEQILKANNYEKYENNIDDLISNSSKKKRYTFITGDVQQDLQKLNKEAFNHIENIHGEYIQIMIISSTGSEGLTLTGVRQVHIMEPFWEFIRIKQVFGRAIRMRSHINLPKKDQNVEQYLYLSMLPNGETIDDIFKSIKELKWENTNDIEYHQNMKDDLLTNHNPIYKLIQKLISIKKETNDKTADQILFDLSEKKEIISSELSTIIKQSSVDCLQNTKDDFNLNRQCVTFDKKIISEDSHFPGITSEKLNEIDKKQFISNFKFFIDPNIYVISAFSDKKKIFIYYQLNNSTDLKDDIDIRYIKENGSHLCDYDFDKKLFFIYENKSHQLNKILGNEFSLFQTIFKASEIILNQVTQQIFPNIDDIRNNDYLLGYIIKYNKSDLFTSDKLNKKWSGFFFSPPTDSNIIKLYDYNTFIHHHFNFNSLKPIFLRNQKLFKIKI